MGTSYESSGHLPPGQRRPVVPTLPTNKAERRVFSLSFAQQRLWLLDRLQPGNPAYNIPAPMPLQGWVDVNALKRSINEIVRRHEALRTTFEVVDGRPAQVVAPSLQVGLEIADLRRLPRPAAEAEMRRIVFDEGSRPFDLAKGPLVRASLLRLDQVNHLLLLVMHHIVSDGWSMSVFYRELSALYMAYARGRSSPLPELPIQYADFTQWQADWFRGKVLEEQLGYWRRRLAGLRPVLDLATDRPRPPVQTNRGDVRGFALSHSLCESLKQLSQSHGATLFMTLLAAFKTLLHRLSGETDIAVGSPIANRTRSELEGLIGFFVNTLVLRTDLSGDPTFIELLMREREVALGAYGHQDMPFEKLVEELQPERNLSHNPLFQILFAVQNIGAVDRNAAPQVSVPQTTTSAGNGTAKFDLTLSLLDTGGGAQGFLEYNTDLFDITTALMIIERYKTLLQGIVENPGRRISRLPISTPAERDKNLAGQTGVSPAPRRAETVGEMVAARAAEAGEAPAVVAGGEVLSYAELNRRAERFARRLRANGAAAGSLVALVMARGLDQLVAVLGIMKAGCVHLPIDASEFVALADGDGATPPRVERMLRDARPGLIIADEASASRLSPGLGRMLLFAALRGEDEGEGDDCALPDVRPESVAAVVYGAGDGGPLLTALTHRALCRAACEPLIKLEASDRVAYSSHACSDSARFEIFGTLAAGATVACLPDAAGAPRKFAAALRDSGVTVTFARAATIEHLAREFPWALRKVRLFLSDERLGDWQRLREALRPEIIERTVSLYGDAGAGGYYMLQPLGALAAEGQTIPMGEPAPGVTAHVLDTNLEPVPDGIPGEVYVETESLASDSPYNTLPQIQPPNWFEPETRLARTGDFARRLPDGSLEYRGRRDGRVIAGGVLVHTSEIESALKEHPRVADAAVAPRQRQGLRDRGLAAFVVPAEQMPPEGELREFLASRLPAHMIPTAFGPLVAVPRTPRGEIDRRALADAAVEVDVPKAAQATYVPPRSNVETALVQLWMETLGADRIGIKDNFFRLGGHSLLATQVVARISDAFKIDLPLQRIFESPTIEELAQIIEPMARADYKPEVMPIVRMPRDRPLPLSFAQQRLWFLDQFEPDSAFYNIAISVRLPGQVDAKALEGAFNDIIERHETLRTTFDFIDGEAMQVIAPAYKLSMPVHDLRRLPEGERQSETRRLVALEAQRPFDLKTGPVLRAELIRVADADHVLNFTVHHIAADGWSTDVLFRELTTFYEARRTGRRADLPELRVQYADFASWQRKWLIGAVLDRQLTYWRRQLADAPALLELPTDRPRPRVQMFRGGMYMFSMPGSLLESVKHLSEQEEATLFTTLLAVFKVLLHRYTGRDDLVVGSPIANRTRPELETLIGFFANTLVLRTQMSGELTFRQLIARVREVTLGAYAHQDIPFEKLVEEFQPERNLSYNPLFQVMFALQNTARPAPSAVAPAAADPDTPVIGAGVAKFDLTMFISEGGGSLQAGIEYNSDLFDDSTIERIARHYETLMAAAVADPDRPIRDLSMLTPAESIALAEWNDTAAPINPACVQQLFEEQAERTPDATALSFGDRTFSYRELDARADYWANRLVQHGVGPDTCVGIMMERSPEMIVAVLAALKAGAAYVPLDPNYPKERVAFMLADSRSPVLITQSGLGDRLQDTEAVVVLTIDGDAPEEAEGVRRLPSRVSPDNLAYVIYTSGSTGRPKGVAMPHGPLTNLIRWQTARSGLPEGARTLQFASLSFDVSFQEIFATLCAGGSLVLLTESQRRDPAALWALIRDAEVNRLFLPYVALQQLAEQARGMTELPASLDEVITAGEQLQITPQIAGLFGRLGASLYNQYGPTESHVVTELKLSGAAREWPARPAIGQQITNAAVQILDRFGQQCAIGIPGELCIGGAVLARGYIHRGGLTAERFIADAQGADGGRLYRTGDRARYLADGNIQFLGRLDEQVKVRGFRVEPGEIEAALRQFPSVREAVVIARQQASGEYRLAAYVQADMRDAPSTQQLKGHLASLLPEYMIPATFTVTGALPLTPSGKLDRRALADWEPVSQEPAPAVYARTPVEEALARMWCEILELPRVGVHDNFFELGGHSLLATRVISRIRDEFGVELPVRRIFEAPTIEALTLSVVEMNIESQTDDETIRLLAEIERMSEEEAREMFGDEK